MASSVVTWTRSSTTYMVYSDYRVKGPGVRDIVKQAGHVARHLSWTHRFSL